MATPTLSLHNKDACAINIPIKLVDDTGWTLELEHPAQAVLPLYGALTELLVAMGQSDRLIGRTEADARVPFLASVSHLPSVGTHLRPDPERIAALRPDLVIQVIGRQDSLEQVARLRALGLPVAGFRLTSFDDVLRLTRWLGEALDASSSAESLCLTIQRRLNDVERRTAMRAQCPTVFFEIRSLNLLAAGQDSFVNDVIRRAGGVNVVPVSRRVARLSIEELLRLDPDVYVYQRGPMNAASMPPDERPHYSLLSSVHNGRVLEVDETMFSRPGPRAVEAVELLEAFLSSVALSMEKP